MTSRYDYSALQVNGSTPSGVKLNGNPIYRLQINGVDTIHKYNEEDFDVRPKITIDSFSRDVEIWDYSDETTADGTFYFPESGSQNDYVQLRVTLETDANVSSFRWEKSSSNSNEIEGTYEYAPFPYSYSGNGGTLEITGDMYWSSNGTNEIKIQFQSPSTMDIFGKYCNGSVTGTIKLPDIQIYATVEGHECSWTISGEKLSFTGTMPTTNQQTNTMTLTFTPIYGSWTSVHTSDLEY